MKRKILLIGASTGGPAQIKELLRGVSHLSFTIVIVQHMKEEVLPFFIKDLRESLSIKVFSTPFDLDFMEPSIIVCSKSCVLRKEYATYSIASDSAGQKYTPDINKLFHSFVDFTDDFEVSVLIMTGIGSDGVEGAKKLKERGAKIYAQDEKSSPVYGMPKAAFESAIVDKVMSLEDIKAYLEDSG